MGYNFLPFFTTPINVLNTKIMPDLVLNVRIDKLASSPDFTLWLVNLVHMVSAVLKVCRPGKGVVNPISRVSIREVLNLT